jgi:hypothetical protein
MADQTPSVRYATRSTSVAVDHRSAEPSPIVDRRGWRAVDDVTGSGV